MSVGKVIAAKGAVKAATLAADGGITVAAVASVAFFGLDLWAMLFGLLGGMFSYALRGHSRIRWAHWPDYLLAALAAGWGTNLSEEIILSVITDHFGEKAGIAALGAKYGVALGIGLGAKLAWVVIAKRLAAQGKE